MVDIEPLVVGGKMWLLVEPFFALISKVTFGRVRWNPHEKMAPGPRLHTWLVLP
jgi:hypothetical protein